ncbi:MAG TPA: PQQ-binding-like beta-propeller repeat protein [Planctomycetota bacterium]|nr:PQQ-binding-like beta-propeller repeat protein [Planctomycetota bacterium]
MSVLLALLMLQASDLPDLGTRKAGADWPCFLGPTHDGKSAEKGLPPKWPAEGPRIVWQRELGDGYAICSVARGRVYQFDRVGNKARLVCLKSETGGELWKFEYPNEYDDMYGYGPGPRCCPVIDDDRVYLYGVEGMLICLKAVDGAKVWEHDTAKEFSVAQNFFGVGSTPLIEGDLLLVQVGGSAPGGPGIQSGEVKGAGSGVVAFDKKTGEIRYKGTDELASYASPVTATIGGRRWGFLFSRGGLVGFEPSTGKVDFHYPWRAPILESVNAANPVVVDDQVLISEAYGVGASMLKVKPGGYEVVWMDGRKRDRSLMTHWNTPVHLDGYVYASSGRHTQEAELRCVEFATGKIQWAIPRLTRSSLTYIDGHFVCLGEDGALRLIKVNPKQYEEAARAVLKTADGEPLLKYPAWAAPVISHGLMYVRGKDRLVCLELIPAK